MFQSQNVKTVIYIESEYLVFSTNHLHL